MGKVIINLPTGFRPAVENSDPDKPYNVCLDCDFLKHTCDGPNMLAMDYPRWVEWANARAKQLRLTRAQIAERSNLPKSTLDSILSGRTQDIRASTMRAITQVLVGGCWGKYPCHLAALIMSGEEVKVDERIEELKHKLDSAINDNHSLRAQLETVNNTARKELEAVRDDDQRKVAYLKERMNVLDEQIKEKDASIRRKERTIAALCVVVALLGSFIIGALIYDKIHPDVGWIRAAETQYYIPMESAYESVRSQDQKI